MSKEAAAVAVNRGIALLRRDRANRSETLNPSSVLAAADLIEWVARRIAANPDGYDQGAWCGTRRCLAGHAIEAVLPRPLIREVAAVGDQERAFLREYGSSGALIAQHLGLDQDDPWEGVREAMVAPEWAFDSGTGPAVENATVARSLLAIAAEFRDLATRTKVRRSACHAAWERHWV